jgi:hypothetical protein
MVVLKNDASINSNRPLHEYALAFFYLPIKYSLHFIRIEPLGVSKEHAASADWFDFIQYLTP